MTITIVVILLVLVSLALIWELVLCEGVHLGPRVVIWLYDLTAGRYEAIKRFNPPWERSLLGDAIANAAGSLPHALVLDVGAGTGRAARAIFPRRSTSLEMYCLEPAARMLRRGRELTKDMPIRWLRGVAVPLPFPRNCFDIVLSLEMLEFTPDPAQTVRELVRVLQPGGWLLITNRVSGDAFLITGHRIRREEVPGFLQENGLETVETYPWQMDYDLVWAQKPAAE